MIRHLLIPRLCVFGDGQSGHIGIFICRKGSTHVGVGETGGCFEHLVKKNTMTPNFSNGKHFSLKTILVYVDMCVFRNGDEYMVVAIRHLIGTEISFVV